VLTHERFTKADVARRYESGWGTIADKLAVTLPNRKSRPRLNVKAESELSRPSIVGESKLIKRG